MPRLPKVMDGGGGGDGRVSSPYSSDKGRIYQFHYQALEYRSFLFSTLQM